MIQKRCKTSLFTALIILMFGVFSFGGAVAQETTDVPKGPAPSTNATEIKGHVPAFQESPAEEEPMLIPTHPPIDQIPPMPMPEKRENGAAAPASTVPGEGVIYNPKTKQTIIMPYESANPAFETFTKGGGYSGADGGLGTELTPASMGTMSKITNTGDHPWRMNVKLVMRFGTNWYVCSGTMRDAETVLTAGHCVYDYGGYGWADEIWVYPGWDGVGGTNSTVINPYGFGYGTYFGSWSGWTGSGDWNNDIGLIGVTRSVGTLTGWFGWAYGYDCSFMTSQLFNNASYPAEYCGTTGLHNGRDMYYWSGYFDYCPSIFEPWNWNRLGLNTSGGCLNAIWGGMSGSGVYDIDAGNRYVHAVTSTSNRSTYAEYTRQWGDWVTWTNGTFIPNVRGSAFDLQALDVNAGPATILAGSSTTLLNHLAVNPTNGTASGTWTYRVYLSTNDNISTTDTLLSTQFYSWNFGAMGAVTVNMAQVTIPANTPAGNYWLGLIYDCGTDGNCANNETDGWDAAPIQVVRQPDLIVQSITTNPTAPAAGQNVSVTVTIKNQGAADATNSFYVDFYKHRTSAPLPNTIGDFACNKTGLASGATDTCIGTVSYASAGTYSMWAQVDTNQQVTESNEGNNVLGPQAITVQALTLTVTKAGNGSGTVTSSPVGINCGAGCSASYNYGTVVTLNATPAIGSTFTGWSGACTGTGACAVTMNASKSVTATFTLKRYTLTATKAGTGAGIVTSLPTGINCGGTCSASYDYGTVVILTATATPMINPAADSVFTGWSACAGTGTCAVTIDADKSVTATFSIACAGQAATILGTEGDDDIDGTPGPDVIHGLGGSDRIHGLGGDDVICGGDGDDRLFGEDGNDILDGGNGNDRLLGGNGNDTMRGGAGDDRLRGNDGDDVMDGGIGIDICDGDTGTDSGVNCETMRDIP